MTRERVVRVQAEAPLVAVACLPEAPAASRLGVVLLNAGLVHRVGPARLWVQLARALARAGLPSLRLDFSGVGDSPDAAGTARFEVQAPREARAALDALAREAGSERFALIGLCSGAEMAFKAALADPRVEALVLVNAPRFLEEPSAELVRRLEQRQAARYYWRVALKNPRSWWKALRGRAQWGAMARAVTARLGGGAPPTPPADSPDAGAFRTLLARGVQIHLVLSEGDWAEDYLGAILGPESGQSAGLERAVVPHTDHLLTPLAAQRALLAHVEGWASAWARDAGGTRPSAAARPRTE